MPPSKFSALTTVCVWLACSAASALAQSPSASPIAGAQASSVPARITQAIDETNLVTLKGNVHPLARPEFDQGVAPPNLQLNRMWLVLKRSPEQEAEIEKLLDEQQDKSSPRYRHWLTPDEFGQQFGPADSDIQVVTSWLRSHGFNVAGVSKGRTIIEFSGTAAQVQEGFHTSIRKYVVNGSEHWANATDPQIPEPLSPVVQGIFTMHDFYKQPQVHVAPEPITAIAKSPAHPQFTSTSGLHALVPADYYTIYNFNPIQLGTEAKIAIVGRSNINLQDIGYFQFWLMPNGSTSAQVIVNGPDPGDLGGGDEAEAVLDTSWASAVAPTAGLALVVSQSTATTDGVDLSELYIIDSNLADVMSESFGDCEANSTSTQVAGITSLAQQAAAQGITYVVSAGDSGSAGCDDPNAETQASHPPSVNVLASTPYTIAVGGTMFNENGHPSTYWNSSNNQGTLGSAISYIPENAWNESCTSGQSGCAKPNIWAGGGGASTLFTKPSWQAGVTGIPADNARDVPDISLTAASHDPYLICLRGSCIPNGQGQISFVGVSGTSVAAPAFAGIMALAGQRTLVRLGQANYVLYRLAATENLSQCNASSTASLPPSTCIFNDITVGNNAVPGESGFGTASAKYQSGKGYDLATGLGSMNVTTLINQWTSVSFSPTTTVFSINPTSATHGDPLNVTVSVTPNSGTAKPTGVVWLLQHGFLNGNFEGDNIADVFTLDSQGSFTGVTHLLPGGTYQVNAHYAGDGTYGGSDSAPPTQVTIQPENTTTAFSVLASDGHGNLIPFTSEPFGTPIYFQAQVNWSSGFGAPTTYVNFWDHGSLISQAQVDRTGKALSSPTPPMASGAHSITAGYSGDNNFNSSIDSTPVNFSITQIATATSLTSQQGGQSLLLTATVTATGLGAGPTGLITFSNGNTVLGTVFLTAGTSSGGITQSAATFDASQLPAGQYSITASYPGDANYIASNSSPAALNLVADFSVSDRGITSQTVSAGQTAQYVNDIAVTPFFGYSSPVNLSCSVPAQATTCSVNPTSVTTSSGQNVASVTVTTTPRSAILLGSPERPSPIVLPAWQIKAVVLLLVVILTFVARIRRPRFAATLAVVLLLAIVVFEAPGCGGGSSGSTGPPPPPQTGTLAGSYTVTVTGTSGNTTHTMTLQLVVN